MHEDEQGLDHPFWRYSLAVYSKDGVPAELIALQDAFGIDVNVALFCLWLGHAMGRGLSSEEIESVCERTKDWSTETVVPLRGVRRYLKTENEKRTVTRQAAAFRTQVKRLELLAEQIEQAILYEWYIGQRQPMPPGKGGRAIAEANLTLFMLRVAPNWSAERTSTAFAATLDAADAANST